MDDLISRRAILKHIEKARQDALMMDDLRSANIIMIGMNFCEDAVRKQPSAEPQVLACDGCRFINTYDTDFPCSRCIRREKDYYDQEQ